MHFLFFIGNLVARLISFFSILHCAFPSKCTMFWCAQKIVRSAIQIYYENQRQQILNQISDYNREVYLSMYRQYDLLRHSAYYCTVTAINVKEGYWFCNLSKRR